MKPMPSARRQSGAALMIFALILVLGTSWMLVSALNNASSDRNSAMVSMLNGEVMCEEFNPSSKVGEWGAKQGVKFMCRGSIPPDMGKFAGFVAIGFKNKPEDIAALKTRINLAATDMSED